MGMDKRDIFDRVMEWKPLAPLLPFYRKHREVLLYLFFGGLTTVLSVAGFWLLTEPLTMEPLLANVFTWVVCVAFAYLTNRAWVFDHRAAGGRAILQEAAAFAGGRLATLGMEELILWVGIGLLRFPKLAVKLAAQILVVLGNYVISKWLVFRAS